MCPVGFACRREEGRGKKAEAGNCMLMLYPQMEIHILVQRRDLNSIQKILIEKNDSRDD